MNSWLKGLLAAVLSGIGTALATYVIAPEVNWGKLGMIALVGAVIGVAGYLKSSPLDK